MVDRPQEGERPAPAQDAPIGKSVPEVKLRDGLLAVTIFSRTTAKKVKQLFVVPERSYRDDKEQWVKTHILHPEDLLPMALLLQRAYSELRVKDADDAKKSE